MGGKEGRVRDEKKEELKKLWEEDKRLLEEERKKAKEEARKEEIKVEKPVVRLCDATIDGRLRLRHGLLKIKGISHALALAIPYAAGLDPEIRIGNLTDEQLEHLERVIRNPIEYGIPEHMVNRRRDPYDGVSRHVVGNELVLTVKQDIERLKRIRCYRGIRHELGLPVRGQRTRSTFRKGKTVGVQRKKK
jgi:small subunit ribosomal protein S13